MPKPASTGVFVCDDHAALRVGIETILRQQDIPVIGSVGTVDEALAYACDSKIDVFVVGLNIGETRGTTIIDLLRERNRQAKIVVYSVYENVPIVSAAYSAGAMGYVAKSSDTDTLVEAIKEVAKGEIYFAPGMSRAIAIYHISGARKEEPRAILTERELTIFVMLAEGRTHKEVAELLGVTEKSIGNRAITLKHKLRIPRDQFTAYALEHNLIVADPSTQALQAQTS